MGAVGTLPARISSRFRSGSYNASSEADNPLGHRTFITGRIGRHEDLDDPLYLLDARVDPGRSDLPALAVHPEPGLAIVQAADHQVDVGTFKEIIFTKT